MSLLSVYTNALRSALDIVPKKGGREQPELQKFVTGRASELVTLKDVGTLEILSKKSKGVVVEIVASPRGNKLKPTDLALFNAQYGGLTVRTSRNFHDRFLIIDDKRLYLIGASLKDLGWKCFAFTQLAASEIVGLKARI